MKQPARQVKGFKQNSKIIKQSNFDSDGGILTLPMAKKTTILLFVGILQQ